MGAYQPGGPPAGAHPAGQLKAAPIHTGRNSAGAAVEGHRAARRSDACGPCLVGDM